METINGQPLDSSSLSGRLRAFQVKVILPRPDGLVYSSDGKHVLIQAGVDPSLEAIADAQMAALDFDIDAEDMRSDADLETLNRRITTDVVRMQIEGMEGLGNL